MSAHPRPEDLDRLLDPVPRGPVDSDRDADRSEAAAHVEGCAACHARMDDLRTVRQALETEPAPTMPADVVSRIDAALAEAALTEGTLAEATHVAPADSAVPSVAPRRVHRVLRWSVAAAAVVAAGIAVTASLPIGGDDLEAATSDDAAASDAGGSAAAPDGPAVTDLQSRATGTDYRPESLAAQLSAVFQGPSDDSAGPSDAEGAAASFACVAELGLDPGELLAADTGEWQGEPALLLVMAATEDLVVYAVPPECGTGADPVTPIEVTTVPATDVKGFEVTDRR